MADPVDFQDFGIAKLKADLALLQATTVTIGWQGPTGAAPHPDADGHTVAEVAAWQEYGTATAPARPGLAVTFERHRAELLVAARRFLADVVDGRKSRDEAEFALGELALEKLRHTIDAAREWARPNAVSTVRAKGHDQPLFDSGTYRGNASWAVRRDGRIVRQGGEVDQ